MPCSAVTLSLATICAVASAALLGIAFGTDNWQYFRVNRNLGGFPQGEDDPEVNSLYLNRTRGLFRTCFLGEKPDSQKVSTYISPVETNCMNVDYHLGELAQGIDDLTEDEQARLYMMRTMIGLFIVSFLFLFISFWTGLAGCWRRSPGNIGATALLLLLACLFSAGSMGLWHGVDYYEREKLKNMPYRGAWNDQLEENTNVWYAWSYFVAWIGVGCALISSLLFFGASVCLRNEREREESKNMAYLMPVYQQKQQYAAYGYGYPGGPYHYGTQPQYGHYNY